MAIDRFDGAILGVGTTSGVRVVVGRWEGSPLGAFADVMLATADDQQVLLAPDEAVAEYVSQTYNFDEVVHCPVTVRDTGDGASRRWHVSAGELVLDVTVQEDMRILEDRPDGTTPLPLQVWLAPAG